MYQDGIPLSHVVRHSLQIQDGRPHVRRRVLYVDITQNSRRPTSC